MKNKDNILLIGMPGSGKSTVGKILAKKTGMKHIDTDALICDAEGMSLHDIIKAKGLEEFKRIEEQTLLDLNVKGCVISTGGSAVYFEKAMEHLKESCTAVYLFTDPDTLLSHIRNLDTRGITFRPGQGFKDLYEERCPLYEKYADITVTAGLSTPMQVARSIIREISLRSGR